MFNVRQPTPEADLVTSKLPAAQAFFHDGRFPALLDVVNHYNTLFTLALTGTEKGDLVEYLKSL